MSCLQTVNAIQAKLGPLCPSGSLGYTFEIRVTSQPACKKAFGKTFVLLVKVQQNITRTELSAASKGLTLGREGWREEERGRE